MATVSASGWRNEPGQVVSEVTARLLDWMRRASLGAAQTPEEVADEIRIGLGEMTGAHSVLVMGRQMPADDLLLLSAPDESFAPLMNDFEETRFGGRGLLSVLPIEPFFVASASPQLQVLVGELWDSTQEARSLARGSHNDAEPAREKVSGSAFSSVSLSSASAGDASAGDASSVETAARSEISAPPDLVAPLRSLSSEGYGEISGLVLLWVESEDGLLPMPLQPALEAAAHQAGGWLAGAMRVERLGASYRNLGAVFANAIDAKDANRTGHSKAVAYYAATIARGLGLPEHEVERIEFAGLLHDIGKVSVPDAILKKNAPLTMDELEIIRSSTVTGADWLREVDGLEEVSAMVRHQGERFDGGGYPDGLSDESIPLGARILAVALRISAMTKPRANRRAMSVVGGALEALAGDSGSSLDPRVVNAFMTTMGRTL